MKISKIGFYGIRNVGAGLVQTIASKGLTAIVYEKNDDIYHNALSIIENNVDYEIEHWGMTRKDKKILMSRIEHIDLFTDFMKNDIDILIESVEENIEIKRHAIEKIKNELDLNIPIILTAQINMLKDIVKDEEIGERCINIHPIPSVPTYKIVEMIKSENVNDATMEIVLEFFEKLDLDVHRISDCPGGIGPRILISTVIEACKTIKEYGVSCKTVDGVMKKGLRMYKGPLKMTDEMGLDTMKIWIEEMNRISDAEYNVPDLIVQMREKGLNGFITKKGFLTYEK